MNVRSVSCSSGTTAASALASCDLTRAANASTSSVINNEAAIGSKLRQLGASLRMTDAPNACAFFSRVSCMYASRSVNQDVCSGIS